MFVFDQSMTSCFYLKVPKLFRNYLVGVRVIGFIGHSDTPGVLRDSGQLTDNPLFKQRRECLVQISQGVFRLALIFNALLNLPQGIRRLSHHQGGNHLDDPFEYLMPRF